MNSTATKTNELTEIWSSILNEFQNVKLFNVGSKFSNSRKNYWFSMFVTTKLGKQNSARIDVSYFRNQLTFNFTNTKTKEMLFLLSALSDKIIENIELLDPTFSMISTFGKIEYPYSYRSKEKREETKKRPPGVKKADIIAKKEQILAFFNELKSKKLPESNPHYDERRVFQVGGTGSKHLVEFFQELGIAKESGKWGSYYTIRFDSDHYVSDTYSVMDEWEKFIQNEIGLQKCHMHTWYAD